MSGLKEAQDFYKQLQGAVKHGDTSRGKALLVKLKLVLVRLPGLQPKYEPTPEALQARQLARDVLEQAVLLSVKGQDDKGVEHNYQQLKTYYAEDRSASPLEPHIQGIYLLHLLVHNRIAEFHVQVELLSKQAQQAPQVAHVIQLEQWMMEGAYNKVLAAVQSPNDEAYAAYLSRLQQTVRQEVADCSESAYSTLSVADAKALMMLDSEEEVLSHAGQANWTVDSGNITFRQEEEERVEEDEPITLIKYVLTYARELERIV